MWRGNILPWSGLFVFAAIFIPLAAQETPAPGQSALIEAENQVTVKRQTGGWEKVPSLPNPLAIGDRVQTGELSRAAVRLTDASILRLDELTTVEIVPPPKESDKESLDISAGATYFFSREKPRELEVRTPAATGALRGTEFVVRVTGNLTRLTMLDGEVQLSNAAGSVTLHSGEEGEVEVGGVPHKTAAIYATNIIQWALYYPAVLDPRELGWSETEKSRVRDSLAAYQSGDLLGALEKYPRDTQPSTTSGRLYLASVLLAVGRVDEAQKEMASVPSDAAARRSLEQMIAAVKCQEFPDQTPQTASAWLAQSYYLQSHGQLEQARLAADSATKKAPDFGYAWVRLAELEFSFGHTPEALTALDRGLALTPRNAQAFALRGFLLSANNDIDKARDAFNEAILLDGALGNAWLGRGLTYIRQGHDEEGRRDLQTAAALEPNRSILRSYLGKAFSEVGNTTNAAKDFTRAKELDPKDPTPWLYSAIENKQENRYNDAVDDLEKSIALNDDRRIYRSQFLLDQDRSIRGTNLAAIYLNDGMVDQSVREAIEAVNDDYDSAPAHLFLANSYNALRDPTRILLRYETPWFNELLLSNLLSPVGGGPLSQFVSEEEYSKMFEQDGFGGSSLFNYRSDGQYEETASQYGTFGNFSYALDTQWFYQSGLRPNNEESREETYGQFKFQLTPQDTLFFQTKFENQSSGDIFQTYDQGSVAHNTSDQTTQIHETQIPGLLLLGEHHQWGPGIDTLFLVGRLEDHQVQTAQDTTQAVISRNVSAATAGLPANPNDFNNPFENPTIQATLSGLTGTGQIENVNTIPLNLTYSSDFVTYTGEFQQIFTADDDTLILGSRFQSGEFDTGSELDNTDPGLASIYSNEVATQSDNVDFERINLYAYDTWHIEPWLSVTGGVTYDHLEYPQNYRTPPINDSQQKIDKVSPKAGFIVQPQKGMTLRAAYTEAVSGASFDESVRLEPTEVDGFTQAYRTLASESLIGSVAGSEYDIFGVSLEQKLPTRTFLGFEYDDLRQNVDRTIGVFDFLDSQGNYPNEILPSSLGADDRYREQVLTGTINQLVGEEWSFGVRYSYTISDLNQQVPGLQAAIPTASPGAVPALQANASNNSQSSLHQLVLSALYNHPSGFFATAEAKWFKQYNTTTNFTAPAMNGDDFWQFDVLAGYRFYRNQCELSCGLLNITDIDYQLDPLNPYEELPRSRTIVMNAKFSF